MMHVYVRVIMMHVRVCVNTIHMRLIMMHVCVCVLHVLHVGCVWLYDDV